MCGSYELLLDQDQLEGVNDGAEWVVHHRGRHVQRHCVRANEFAPVLVPGKGGANNPSVQIALMKVSKPVRHSVRSSTLLTVRCALHSAAECTCNQWGLVPAWDKARTNIPSETIKEDAGAPCSRRPCVVVSTGFFAWDKGARRTSRKTPFLVNVGTPAAVQRTLLMAGVFDAFTPPDSSETLFSYAIVTSKASDEFAWLHHRVPCILATAKDVSDWLAVGCVSGTRARQVLQGVETPDIVWTQMSGSLERPVGEARSWREMPDIKRYFPARTGQKGMANAFPRSFAQRLGVSVQPAASNGPGTLAFSIKKKKTSNRDTGSGSQSLTKGRKASVAKPRQKKEEPEGQKTISSFFAKK